MVSINNASWFFLGIKAGSYAIQLLSSEPSTETVRSLLPKQRTSCKVKLAKSVNEMKDMVLTFVLDLHHYAFNIYTNGELICACDNADATFSIVHGCFYPFIRTVGIGVHVASISNFSMPLTLPGNSL